MDKFRLLIIVKLFVYKFSVFLLTISLYSLVSFQLFISFQSQGLFFIDNENVRWLLAFGCNLIIYQEYSYNLIFKISLF